ncbi:MAG TPA: hypothetical protein DCS09_11275 [Porphyromonadaceae bacterium]|nr:hypothetical protein [Porphyromonadaceae bacterium]
MRQAWADVNKIIHKVVEGDNNAAIVETGDLTSNPDFIHFDAPSQRIMGERYAEAYLQRTDKKAH